MQSPKPKNWIFSNKDLLGAVEAIYNSAKVNREYDIPLLAGYSLDGKTLYIDKDLPKGYAQKDGTYVKVDDYLILHEGIESALLHTYAKINYPFAHEVSLRAEQDAVKAAGIDEKQYNGFMDQWIKKVRSKPKFNCPPDLDLTPYKDSKENEMMAKMGVPV